MPKADRLSLDYERIHRNYEDVIKRIRKKVDVGEKVTVAFFISQRQLWNAGSVYDSMMTNTLFDPRIVVFPNREDKVKSNADTAEENYRFFADKGMEVVYGYDTVEERFFDYERIKADIVFFDQVYPRLPIELRWPMIYRHTLVCYIPYGYKISNSNEAHFNKELQNSSWRVFAESEWHKEGFVKYGALKGTNVVVSGYPKLDTYNQTSLGLSSVDSKRFKRTVIWAPHWSIKDTFLGYSTFDKNYQYFLKAARRHDDIYWVFKPHQRLRYHLEEIGFMSSDEVEEYYSAWETMPNATFYDESDYFEIFKHSDALITDCGSFLAEYLPTQRPVLLLVSEASVGYNEVGMKIIEGYYKACADHEIETFINRVVIEKDDPLKEKRSQNLRWVRPNREGAGKSIVEHIQNAIKGSDD